MQPHLRDVMGSYPARLTPAILVRKPGITWRFPMAYLIA